MEPEFNLFVYEIRLQKLLRGIRASFSSGSSFSSNSPFVTVYERAMYEFLKPKVRNTYHQATIDGRSIDILCIPNDLSSAWAIEIDGAIHRRKAKAKRDTGVKQKLNRLGVSLVRVPNHMVSNDPDGCGEKILQIIGAEA